MPEIVGTIAANRGPNSHDAGNFHCNQGVDAGHILAFGGNNTSGPIDIATACTACTACKTASGRMDFASETFIAHTLRSEGFDASEDGTGRGTPIIPIGFNARQDPDSWDDRTGPIDTNGNTQAIAFSCKDNGRDVLEFDKSHANGGDQVAVAFTERTRSDERNLEYQEELAYAVTNLGSGGRTHSRQIMSGMQVRRLTPLECLRLQGFPDDWLDDLGLSDSAKYRMIGNGVALPVVEWIAMQIRQATR